MTKIAVIEDDPDLVGLLQYNLAQHRYQVVSYHTGYGALEFLRDQRPDLVVLDVMLPGDDGIEICRQIRTDELLQATPVIFLTGRAGEADRVLGLETGGNDYMVKPFSVRELCARIKIQLRGRPTPQAVLRAGPIELNRSELTVKRSGAPVSLTPTEFRLLEHLMSYPGQVFRRDRLLDAVWGQRREILERTVDAYIVRLRYKIEPEPSNPQWIHSLRGVGYTFRAGES